VGRKATGVSFTLNANSAGVAKGTREAAGAFAQMGTAIGHSITVLDHAMNIAKRGFDLLRGVIVDTIGTAINFRAKGDGVREMFYGFTHSVDVLKARIGDAFLPTLLALAEAFKPLIDAGVRWLTVNNRMLSQKVGEFFISTGKVIATVLLPAIRYTGLAFLGWEAILDGVRYAFDEFIAGNLDGLAALLNAMKTALSPFGIDNPLSKAVGAAATAVEGLGRSFHESADANLADISKVGDKIDAWNAKIDGVSSATWKAFGSADALLKKWTQIGPGATVGIDLARQRTELYNEALAKAGKAGNVLRSHVQTFEEIQEEGQKATADLERARAGMLGIAEAAKSASPEQLVELTSQLHILEEQARVADFSVTKMLDAQKQRIEALSQGYAKYGEEIGNLFGQIADGTLKGAAAASGAARIVLHAVRDVAMKAIEAAAAKSAAEAYASQAGIPIVGPFLAVGAASAAFAFVDQFLTKFATGGFVGGTGDRDTVPALLTPGEYVMSRSEVAAGAPKWQRPAMQVVVNNVNNNIVPESDAQFSRRAMAFEKLVQDAITSGRIRIPAPALGSP